MKKNYYAYFFSTLFALISPDAFTKPVSGSADISIEVQTTAGSSASPVTCRNSVQNCLVVLDVPIHNTGTVLITNNSISTAINIAALLPVEWGDVRNDNRDCLRLEPGHTCSLLFQPGILSHSRITVPVRGLGTNTVYFDMVVLRGE